MGSGASCGRAPQDPDPRRSQRIARVSADQKQCLPGSLLLNPETFRGVVCHEDKEAQMPFQPLFEAPADASALPGKPFDFYACLLSYNMLL